MTKYTIDLIDNTYSNLEAREILMGLLTHKIDFITMKIFSEKQRFDSDTSKYEKRLKELESQKSRLLKMFNGLAKSEEDISLKCTIDIGIEGLS